MRLIPLALLWEHDRRTAYLLGIAYGRVWAVVNAMDGEQTVALALDALDRGLATIDGDRLAPPESAL